MGEAFNFIPARRKRAVDKTRLPPEFTIPGTRGTDYLYAETTAADGTVHWELAILTATAKSVAFSRVVPVDIFLVGGGAPGSSGSGDAKGGAGGRGGERVTKSAVTLIEGTSYPVSIGQSGKPTTAFGYTARSAQGSYGGQGAQVDGVNRLAFAAKGNDGVPAFYGHSVSDLSLISSLRGRLYGAGAGGGECRSSNNGNPTWSNSWEHGGSNEGGSTGGGRGGTDPSADYGSRNGTDGKANTGAGGGGAAMDGYSGVSGTPGAGGSGIIIIRDAR